MINFRTSNKVGNVKVLMLKGINHPSVRQFISQAIYITYPAARSDWINEASLYRMIAVNVYKTAPDA